MIGSNESTQVPRRVAARIPSRVPKTKLSTVATPTSASVHGSAVRITEETVDGKKVDGDPEVAVQDLAQVGEVLADEALPGVDAEGDREGVKRGRRIPSGGRG